MREKNKTRHIWLGKEATETVGLLGYTNGKFDIDVFNKYLLCSFYILSVPLGTCSSARHISNLINFKWDQQ